MVLFENAGPLECQEREVELGKRRKLFSVYDVHEEIGRCACSPSALRPHQQFAHWNPVCFLFQGNLWGSEACGSQTDRRSVCRQVPASAEQHADQGLSREGPAFPSCSPQGGLSAGLFLHQTHPGAHHRNVSSNPSSHLSSKVLMSSVMFITKFFNLVPRGCSHGLLDHLLLKGSISEREVPDDNHYTTNPYLCFVCDGIWLLKQNVLGLLIHPANSRRPRSHSQYEHSASGHQSTSFDL